MAQAGQRRRKGRGHPRVGPLLKAHMPPWITAQLDVLVEHGTRLRREARPSARGMTRADVMRDVLRVGLMAMRVKAPGFNPGRALLKARARGEPE